MKSLNSGNLKTNHERTKLVGKIITKVILLYCMQNVDTGAAKKLEQQQYHSKHSEMPYAYQNDSRPLQYDNTLHCLRMKIWSHLSSI